MMHSIPLLKLPMVVYQEITLLKNTAYFRYENAKLWIHLKIKVSQNVFPFPNPAENI